MEKKRKFFSLLLLFFCVSLLAALSASAEKSKRKYNITVSDVRVSKKSLKPGDRCKVSMKIRNKGYSLSQRRLNQGRHLNPGNQGRLLET